MVGRSELPNAVALNSSLFNIARIVGPALAGLLIAAVGAGWCFAVNTVSFVAVLARLPSMRRPALQPQAALRKSEPGRRSRRRFAPAGKKGALTALPPPRVTAGEICVTP